MKKHKIKDEYFGEINVHEVEELGAAFGVVRDALVSVPINKDGSIAGDLCFVTSVENETDLKLINITLETDFKMSDFIGR